MSVPSTHNRIFEPRTRRERGYRYGRVQRQRHLFSIPPLCSACTTTTSTSTTARLRSMLHTPTVTPANHYHHTVLTHTHSFLTSTPPLFTTILDFATSRHRAWFTSCNPPFQSVTVRYHSAISLSIGSIPTYLSAITPVSLHRLVPFVCPAVSRPSACVVCHIVDRQVPAAVRNRLG